MIRQFLAVWTVCFFCALNVEASDLQITDLKVGTGVEAQKNQTVVVHYTGWLMDGTKFDSSLDRDQPFSFSLGMRQVIPGWDKGVEGMKVGGKRELIIPPRLAYGPGGAAGIIPPNATLKFEVELLEVRAPRFKNIDNVQLKDLMSQGVKVIDIRTPGEFKQTGIVDGSLLLPFRMQNGQINQRFPQDLAKLVDVKEPFVLICRTGNRSQMAAQVLSDRFGYTAIHNHEKGITSWMREKNPTVKADLGKLKNTCSLC